jgi:hypothetical protein
MTMAELMDRQTAAFAIHRDRSFETDDELAMRRQACQPMTIPASAARKKTAATT